MCDAGIAQLHRHSDGTKELASLAVEPGVREHGIATQMVDALLAGTSALVSGRPLPCTESHARVRLDR
jgi:hypothetical protein